MTWSYSRVKCFDDCPYRWFLKYITEEEDSPQFYSSYGSFMHKIIELYEKEKISKEQAQLMFVRDFQKEVKGERPSGKIVENFINAGISYLENMGRFPLNTLGVEERIDFDIDGIKFIAFIDYIGEKDGDIYIIDNKSRNLKNRSTKKKPTKNDLELDEMLKQLYVYSLAVKNKYGKFPKFLCFNCFKNNEFIKEPFNEEKYNEAIAWVKSQINDIKNEKSFSPNIEYFACKYICGVNNECCYYK